MALPNNPTPAELVKEVKALDTNKMDKANPTGTGSLSINRKSGSTIGTNSVATGYNTIAAGNYSCSEGRETVAYGESSHVEGRSLTGEILLTGEANATTYTYVNSGNKTINVGNCICYPANSNIFAKIIDFDTSNTTITLDKTLYPMALSNAVCYQYFGVAYSSNSHAEGYCSNATGSASHSEGYMTKASGENAHTEGTYCEAKGKDSHAEGSNTFSTGNYSHAEGRLSNASATAAHAEGAMSTASGVYSHAEGAHATSAGYSSHSEGYYTEATGDYSHAEGQYNTAQRKSQHVFGEFNVLDTKTDSGYSSDQMKSRRGDYVEIVGNGTGTSARSNARTLDWSGNETLAGWVNMNGSVPAVGYDSSGTSTAEQTLLDNYYTKNQSDNRYYTQTQVDNLGNQKEDKFDYVTLWTNSDVTQSLVGLDVPLTNLSQYRGFVLHYRRAKDYDIVYNQTIIIPPTQRSGGVNFNLIGVFGYLVYCRNCEINYTNNKFIIKTAYKQTSFGGGSSDSDKLIPVVLIGIK